MSKKRKAVRLGDNMEHGGVDKTGRYERYEKCLLCFVVLQYKKLAVRAENAPKEGLRIREKNFWNDWGRIEMIHFGPEHTFETVSKTV
jgi:hypothetical protein